MENFTYQNPTKLIFGKGQLEQLKTEVHPMAIKYYLFTVVEVLNEMDCMTSDRKVKRNQCKGF